MTEDHNQSLREHQLALELNRCAKAFERSPEEMYDEIAGLIGRNVWVRRLTEPNGGQFGDVVTVVNSVGIRYSPESGNGVKTVLALELNLRPTSVPETCAELRSIFCPLTPGESLSGGFVDECKGYSMPVEAGFASN
jgi:hypothetical protein